MITMSNTNKNITPKFLPHLFKHFHQTKSNPTHSHTGLNIGLALARDLVELHGGDIDARSDGKAKGATFTIQLPVVAVTQPAGSDEHARRAPAAPASLSSVRVLVVDDEVDARDLLRELLEGAGATVLAVESAAAALDAVTSWRPDVIVSDIGMPVKDGYTLVQEIRALTDARARSVPAIALTAYTGVDDIARARRAGFQAHLAKPVDAAELLSQMLTVVRRNPAAA